MAVIFHDVHADPELRRELNKGRLLNAVFDEVYLLTLQYRKVPEGIGTCHLYTFL